LRRLAAPRNVYAFHGVSRAVPDDERLFVLAEVRAALPGTMGTLHEAAFVHTFAEAARTLRRLRNEHEAWQSLHWNRLSLVVRPAFYLLPATLTRLARELLPATEYLGLEKIIVRLARRQGPQDPHEVESELVIEPSPDGPAHISWRAPHHEPLLPADRNSRRLAQARRRGVIYPYDALRLFTQGTHDGAAFAEYDLDPATRRPISVAGRQPGENRAAVVFGLISTPTAKHPDGMRRVCVLSDPTRDLGALAAAECERLVAALDLAAELSLPVEWIAHSAGARIAMDSGTENLDAVARVVRRIVHFTQGGGEINVIVAGVNVGAQSYFDALSTMLMHTRGILVMTEAGSMVLTGRAALEASGGVSAEDERGIGGFERVMGPNGQAQYYARDLAEAYEILLRHYAYTYVAPGESQPRRLLTTDALERDITDSPYAGDAEGFDTVGEILRDETNPGRKRPFAIRPLLRAVADGDGGWLERWSAMAGAETAVVGDAHLGGHPVCMIGVENRPLPRPGHPPLDGPDQWTGATLFPASSKKVARAINAASGNRPVVLLANLAGFDGSPESMRRLQLEYGAEIARAVVNFRGPFLFVVVSRYHGGAYVVFSRHLNEQVHAVALTGSYASVIGGGPAASVIFPGEVRRRTLADKRITALEAELEIAEDPLQRDRLRVRLASLRGEVAAQKHAEVAAEFDRIHSVERAREVGSLHAIIAPQVLRRYLIEQLERTLP
jgi:acetyl-CoA carboxylase carboxyltransferase component